MPSFSTQRATASDSLREPLAEDPPGAPAECQPFSLLNALLEDVPGAVSYDPPTARERSPSPPPAVKEAVPEVANKEPDVPSRNGSMGDLDPSPSASKDESPGEGPQSKEEPSSKAEEAAPSTPAEHEEPAGHEKREPAEPSAAVEEDEGDSPPADPLAKLATEPVPLPFPSTSTAEAVSPPAAPKRPRPKPPLPTRGFQTSVSRLKPPSADPINKALRIFESLAPEAPASPKPKDSEPAKPVPPTAIAPPPPAIEEPKPKAPEPPPVNEAPPTEAIKPPPPKREEIPAPSTPSFAADWNEAEIKAACEFIQSLRQPKKSANPWGAAPTASPGAVDEKLSDLAAILEAAMPEPRAEAPPAKAPPEPEVPPTPPQAKSEPPPDDTAEPAPPNAPPAPPAPLEKAAPAPPSPSTSPVAKVKLVPRALKTNEKFEITAPTTLVAGDAAVSPFTKVAEGFATDVAPKPGAPQKPQKGAASSPFAVVQKDKPLPKAPPEFASPFSAALKKRAEGQAPSPPPAKRPPNRPQPKAKAEPAQQQVVSQGLRVAPIRPPGDDSSSSSEPLPPPTYSFATIGHPSQHPSAQQKIAVTEPTAPLAEDVEIIPPAEPEKREIPQQSWNFLTRILIGICVIFLLIYIYEIYHNLRRPPVKLPDPIPQNAPEVQQSAPGTNAAIESEEATLPESPLTETPLADPVELEATDPVSIIQTYLSATSIPEKLACVVEDSSIHDQMRAHFEQFGGFEDREPLSTQIANHGTFTSGRTYLEAKVTWENETPLTVRLVEQGDGAHRFGWYTFEQWRHQLLKKFVKGEWSAWPHFYVEVKPVNIEAASEDDRLWYLLSSPEDPDFRIEAFVVKDSLVAKDCQKHFSSERKYEAVLQLEAPEIRADGTFGALKIIRLIRNSWDPTP